MDNHLEISLNSMITTEQFVRFCKLFLKLKINIKGTKYCNV